MAQRYKNAYRDETSLVPQPEPDDNQEEVEDTPTSKEEETWKGRYGNLRSHSARKEKELQDQINELKTQVEDAKTKSSAPPKTAEEFKAWASKYPDVVANMRTLVREEGQNIVTDIEKQKSELAEVRKKLQRDTAYALVNEAHPDFFSSIRKDPKFHEWIDTKSNSIKRALYENDTDAEAAIDAITLYKLENSIASPKKKSEPKPEDIAEGSDTRSSRAAPRDGSIKYKFKESDVERMNDREYSSNEDAIMEAIRKGEFEYDLTGNAR